MQPPNKREHVAKVEKCLIAVRMLETNKAKFNMCQEECSILFYCSLLMKTFYICKLVGMIMIFLSV